MFHSSGGRCSWLCFVGPGGRDTSIFFAPSLATVNRPRYWKEYTYSVSTWQSFSVNYCESVLLRWQSPLVTMSARYPFEIRLQFPLWCLPSLSERAMRQEQSVCPTQAVPCLERPHAAPQRTHNACPTDPQDSTRSFSYYFRPESQEI